MDQTLSKRLEQALSNLSSEAIEATAPSLRQMALSAGWPSSIISKLDLRTDSNGSMYIYYPEEVKEQIENLEYGDINSLPNAVIRPFMLRAGQIANKKIDPKVVEELISLKMSEVL